MAAVVSTICCAVSPVFAGTTLQAFTCDQQRASVTIQSGTAHDRKFLIPGINKVAVLVDAEAQGPVGINYEFNPPVPFQFISWFYKQATGSRALQAVTVRYCVQRTDGTDKTSYDIQGGNGDRGGPVGDGWAEVVQDNRAGVPNFVQNGDAVITKLTYIFQDNNKANNITLGRVDFNSKPVSTSQITTVGPCSLKDQCTGI